MHNVREQERTDLLEQRRTFLRNAAAVGITAPAAASLLGLTVPDPAEAAPSDGLPDYAPVPPTAFGPKPNDSGYYVGRIAGNLYWVTDTIDQSLFLTTTDGVVVIDAPPTIGHNLLRAIDEITSARRLPARVTHAISRTRTPTTSAPPRSKYLQKLGGADVFTLSNAEAMITSTRIDAGILGPFGIHP